MIISARVPVVLILTYRGEEVLTPTIRKLLSTAHRVQLNPFTEEETAVFVADTLHRPKEYCLPLVAVVQEKTGGNPFFVREMLDAGIGKSASSFAGNAANGSTLSTSCSRSSAAQMPAVSTRMILSPGD